jgi:hypothetical protein
MFKDCKDLGFQGFGDEGNGNSKNIGNINNFSAYEVKEESNYQEFLIDFNVALFPSLNNNILYFISQFYLLKP